MCTENLNPDIMVMKSAEDWAWANDSGSLNRARDRHIFSQRPVRSDGVVIARIGLEDAA